MTKREAWAWWLFAALVAVGCQGETVYTEDAGPTSERGEICFPSCRLGEVCTADNRCVVPTSPFRDAGFARDRGPD